MWKINFSYFSINFNHFILLFISFSFLRSRSTNRGVQGQNSWEASAALLPGGVKFRESPVCCHAAICLDHWHMTEKHQRMQRLTSRNSDSIFWWIWEHYCFAKTVFGIKMHLIYKSFLKYFIIDIHYIEKLRWHRKYFENKKNLPIISLPYTHSTLSLFLLYSVKLILYFNHKIILLSCLKVYTDLLSTTWVHISIFYIIF